MDKVGAKGVVVVGAAVSAIGFFLWSERLTTLSSGSQWWAIILAGAGMGLIIGPAATDASNRSAKETYGEVTGITQTVRYFGSSVGLAVFMTILIENTSAGASYYELARSSAGRLEFAHAMQDVFYAMSAMLAVTFVVALVGLQRGRQEVIPDLETTA